MASRTFLSHPAHDGTAKRGRPAATRIITDCLKEGVDLQTEDLMSAVVDRGTWRRTVETTDVRPLGPT